MADRLRPGDPAYIGRYRTLSRLGEGGMGSVFLAEAPGGRLVAVKVIRPEYAHEEEFRARFRSEVSRAREVPPFCTAEVLDADPDSATPYLVVEYVDGPDLSEVVAENGPLGGGSLHGVAVGVAAALAAIHGAGVIHRDLKPRNVLFALGIPKVIDFGIARPLEATSYHTRPEVMVGTLAYMAPERLDPDSDRLLTPAVDVFAWGGVVAYAGTGHTPFGGDTPAVTAARLLTQPPRVSGLPPYLAELVSAALEKEPANRPTAPELLDRLLVGGASSAPPLPAPLRQEAEAAARQAQPRRHPGRRRLLVATAAVTLVAAAAGVGFRLLDDAPTAPVSATPTRAQSAAPNPVPTGPTIFDSLLRSAFFDEKTTEEGSCSYRKGLRVRANGAMICDEYQRLVFPAEQSVSVRATLASTGSCATVWFRATGEDDSGPDGYHVDVCSTEVSLTGYSEGQESLISSAKRTTTIGAPHRLLLVVRAGQATVSVDGEQVLSGPLTESALVSGRVLLGATGRRADVTYTDAQLRSGADPATPAVPAFLNGDAQLTVGAHMTYDEGRVAIIEPTEYLSGQEYCRRLSLAPSVAKCRQKYVSVPSSTRVAVPIADKRTYFDYGPDQARCVDRRTRVATCKVSFRDFGILNGSELSPPPARVAISSGRIVSVARLHLG